MIFDILSIIPGKKKLASKNWYSFNAVCCHHLGHRADDRRRGGITFDVNDDWTYHCFNCGFSTRFTVGKPIPYKAKQLLTWCGISEDQINKWSFESLRQKSILDVISDSRPQWKIKFDQVDLPENSVLLDPNDTAHSKYIDYVQSRGFRYDDFPFLITPTETGRNENRIIIPYTYKDKIVGYISRYLDNRTPKYIKNQQLGYVFGYDQQKPDYEVCLVFEGVLDAISLNGCALGHDTISDEQASVLRQLHRRIIVVPDQDKTGLTICERALDLGFQVSMPNWGEGIKDANDAVRQYGKLPTLLSILQSATSSKIKLELQRKKLAKRI